MAVQNRPEKQSNFNSQQIIPSISSGLLTGVITVIVSVSFAALMFSGDLSGYVSNGVGLILLGALITPLISAFTSSIRNAVATPQDAPSALLGIEIAGIAALMVGTRPLDDIFMTAVGMIIAVTLITSLTMFILGFLNLGIIVRFIPFPVIGGFLAGTGWLLFKGGFGIVDVPFHLLAPQNLLADGMLLRWGPTLLFAIILFVLASRINHPMFLPGMMVLGAGVFFATLYFTGTSIAAASADGWFLSTGSSDDLFQIYTIEALERADWSYITNRLPRLGAVVVVSVISMLLNINAIEFSNNQRLNLKREMYSTGVSNLVSGAVGSTIGYPSVALTVLGTKLKGVGKLAIFVHVAVVGSVLFFGNSLLTVIPKPVLSGLIIFLGFNFLKEWVVDTYSKMDRGEYLVIWVILIAINTLGVLEGVGIGLVLAIGIFVVNYSRTDVIRHTLTATNYRSSVDRDSVFRRVLENRGDWLRILELQGYMFFGTSNKLYEYIRATLQEDRRNEIKYIVLGFRFVTGVDAAAVMSFSKIIQMVNDHGARLIYVSLPENLKHLIAKEVKDIDEEKELKVFNSLDYGVEWCEDEVIRVYQSAGLAQHTRPANKELTVSDDRKDRLSGLMNYLEQRDTDIESVEKEKSLVERLSPYTEHKQVKAEELIIGEGNRVDGLYFIEGGSARVEIRDPEGNLVRLRKMTAGAVVGEISLYSTSRSTANVIAAEECDVFYLAKESIRKIEEEDIALANDLHKFLAELLGFRLASTTDTLRALLD